MAQSIREILDAREREVRRAIDDIRTKQLAPLERELTEIVIARSAILGLPASHAQVEAAPDDEAARYARMTYEELAREAFLDKFDRGATIVELLTFISKEYGRDIAQGSFSPILSRMRAAGALQKFGKVWMLPTPEADDEDELSGLVP